MRRWPPEVPDPPELFDEEDRPRAALETRFDSVRLYLREIGKIPLLTAAEEIEICRRIESAQFELRRALAGVPVVLRRLLELADLVRNRGRPLTDVILLPDAGHPTRETVASVLNKFARIRRLAFQAERRTRCRPTTRRSAVAARSRTVRLPVHVTERSAQLSRSYRALLNELGQAPSPERELFSRELTAHVEHALSELPPKRVRQIQAKAFKTLRVRDRSLLALVKD